MFIPGMKKTRKKVDNPVERIVPLTSIITDLEIEELTSMHDDKESSPHTFTIAVLATLAIVVMIFFSKRK